MLFPKEGGKWERIYVQGINRFASCKTEVYVSSFLKIVSPTSFSYILVLMHQLQYNLPYLVCFFNSFISYHAQLSNATSAYSSSGLMNDIYIT